MHPLAAVGGFRQSTRRRCVPPGHTDNHLVLFSAAGRILLEPFPSGYTPLEWDGDRARELIGTRDYRIGDFNGKDVVAKAAGHPKRIQGDLAMVADLYGDFRDELVVITAEEQDKMVVSVFAATSPVDCKYLSATENLDYRLWLARNMGAGYRSILYQPLRAAEPRYARVWRQSPRRYGLYFFSAPIVVRGP